LDQIEENYNKKILKNKIIENFEILYEDSDEEDAS